MTTEDFVVDDGGYRETVETICEGLPQLDAVPPLACMVRERGRREREIDRQTPPCKSNTTKQLYRASVKNETLSDQPPLYTHATCTQHAISRITEPALVSYTNNVHVHSRYTDVLYSVHVGIQMYYTVYM